MTPAPIHQCYRNSYPDHKPREARNGDIEIGLFHLLLVLPPSQEAHEASMPHSVAERSQTVADMVGLSSLVGGPGSLYEELVL